MKLFAEPEEDRSVDRDAVISDCSQYRYRLTRQWGDRSNPVACVFIMLNPSTADAAKDDPTIRRCISFAKREGCNLLEVVNLFAWRATDPGELPSVGDPVGPDNDFYLRQPYDDKPKVVVAAWGACPFAKDRAEYVLWKLLAGIDVMCLGTTKAGHPRHPLYVKNDQPLIPYGVEARP